MAIHWHGKTVNERSKYAGKEEFASVFECKRTDLRMLALLLTADSDAAQRCMLRAFHECVGSSSVSREWVFSWSRRVVIRTAISLVICRDNQSSIRADDDTENAPAAFLPDDTSDIATEAEMILDLPELDRFVFVICALVGYSLHDCALLMSRPLRDINEAWKRATSQIGHNIQYCL